MTNIKRILNKIPSFFYLKTLKIRGFDCSIHLEKEMNLSAKKDKNTCIYASITNYNNYCQQTNISITKNNIKH